MSTLQFMPATRSAMKSRIALLGPSGSGKTYTALSLATALSDSVAVIDTERGSASMYVGINEWQFHTVAPQSFSPASLIELLSVASGQGFGCVVVDSLSHYWMGIDGMLEQADQRAKGGNSFSGWKEVRPDERRMLDALVSYPGHVIVTLRVKTEYVIEDDPKSGKKVPRKVGMRPEQRDGIEYEFDVVGDLNHENTLTVSKTRIPALSRAVIREPGAELAITIRDWLDDGDAAPGPLEYRARVLATTNEADLRTAWGEIERAGLQNAPVTDSAGQPTTLSKLVKAHRDALRKPNRTTQAPPAAPATQPEALVLAKDVAGVQQRAVERARQEPRDRAGEPAPIGKDVQQIAAQVKPQDAVQEDGRVAKARELATNGALTSLMRMIEQLEKELGDDHAVTIKVCDYYQEAKEAADLAQAEEDAKYRPKAAATA